MIHDKSIAWPGGAKCAVMITFDFDAETLWTGRDPRNASRPGVLSQGRYGATVGVPKILEMLSETETPATFFVPGWTVENHSDKVEMILKGGVRGRPPFLFPQMGVGRSCGRGRGVRARHGLAQARGRRHAEGLPLACGRGVERAACDAVAPRAALRCVADGRHQPVPPRAVGRVSRADRAALALEPGRRALCALLHRVAATDLHQQPHR